MSDFLLEDNFDATFWDKPKKGVKKGKMNKWQSPRIQPTKPSRSGYGSEIRSAYAAGRKLGSMKRASLSRTKPRTSKAVEKKRPVSSHSMSIPSAAAATSGWVASPMSTWTGKSPEKAKRLSTRLSSNLTRTIKKTANWNSSTGNKNSKKTSVLVADSDSLRVKIEVSVWDRLFAYVGLVIFAGLAIKPLVIPDVTARIAIVLLATHTLVRRFR